MILTFFPLKKLRRNGKYVLFGAILLVGAVAVYHEMVAAKSWRNDGGKSHLQHTLLNKCLSRKAPLARCTVEKKTLLLHDQPGTRRHERLQQRIEMPSDEATEKS